MKNGINVLSLFDGMSCGQIALEKVGIPVNKYFASEIDKYAMQVTQDNYPNTIQMGSVADIDLTTLPKIDLLMGGSPCQGFSIAGKKLNFDDPRSKLFFEFVKAKEFLKPKYFLLENVKMKDEIADAIDEIIGVKRQFVNSRCFTGHIRKRYYWTNLHLTELPKTNIKLKDIVDFEVPFDKDLNFFLDRTPYAPTESYDGIKTINPKQNNGKQTWQRGRVYDVDGNMPTICASLFDLNITKNHKTYRKLTINECEKAQGVPKYYTKAVSKNEAGKMLGNGWTVDVIAHIFKNINLKNQ
ncbi:DNA methyltransferase [Cellulophaga phage phi18:3]|uniref:DNA (cytosine-5-)-methyltransferase n=1 Tax=Cellulophaga phage phi18:3 TaxID=1327983 RepID=S0A158_9CAUD|nr:DNA methyltransferase [Cellulophaga phage phi18:3]AGO48525.1 DNA methylase [Cellulophaga phage phi18:3]